MDENIKTLHHPGSGAKILFVLGWGVTLADPAIGWFFSKAEARGWDLLSVELPVSFRDFGRLLEQIRQAGEAQGCEAIVSFSLGALFSSFLDASRRVFVSPWWGNPRRKLIFGSLSFSYFLMRVLQGVNIPLIPRGYTDADLGTLDLSGVIPARISPATLHQVMRAQSRRPLPRPDDTIIYCPQDSIVDTELCTGGSLHTYNGGHDFMATPERDRVFSLIAGAVEGEAPGAEE